MAVTHEDQDEGAAAPLTHAEQRRVHALLDEVPTRTLLHSLVGVGKGSADADLIIAVLMDRLPSGPDEG